MATANLIARFRLVDEMSQRLAEIADSGRNMLADWDSAGQLVNSVFDDMGSAAVGAADHIDGVVESIGGLRGEARRGADAAAELGRRTEESGGRMEQSMNRAQSSVATLANVLTTAGIAKILDEIAGAFFSASNAAAEFENGIAQISTIADTTRTSISDISADIMQLSMDTGQSANGLSEATYSAISASVDTAAAVEFTASATKLAGGGFTSSATSVDVLTTSLNAYGLEVDRAESIADMLITTQKLGKTTVDELAASVGKVIPIAAAYGVEMDNLSTAYAELTKGGIATAEAGTYLKAMLNELGDSGSMVSAVLREQTGQSFAKLTAQGYSLGDVMVVLGESVNGDAGAFNELWSSSEAGVGALSLYNAGAAQFNTTLAVMQNSLGATDAAYTAMTDTTAHAHEEMLNASDNLQIAIGQNINPLFSRLYETGTSVLNMFTRFAAEHPVVVKAVSAIAIGVGTVAAGMAGVAAASVALHTAIPAVIAFGSAVNTALGPIGWVAMAIGGLTVAVAAFVGMLEGAEDETAGMTAATREQYYELQDLNAEYEKACEKYGETSVEAARLKYQVDDLSAAFTANRQTLAGFVAEVDALCESSAQISSSFDEGIAAAQSTEVGVLALIQKYADLSGQAALAGGQQAELAAVTTELSRLYPDLTGQLNDALLTTDEFTLAVKQLCRQQAEEQRQQQAQDTYIAALQKQAELTAEIAKAEENLNLERERLHDLGSWGQAWANKDDLKAYQQALEDLNAANEENNALIAQIKQGWADIAAAEDAAADGVRSWQEAISSVYGDVQADIEDLCAAYDAAYQAAQESFAGQFSLFDTAEADMSATVANAQEALESQLAYWETYLANVEVLKNTSSADLGITQANYEALMAYAQDGSAQAAGFAASLASAIKNGNKDAVTQLADTAQKVTAKQQEVAAATADWLTNFSAQMDEIKLTMQNTVEEMNLDREAKAAASATIEAYTAQILAGKNNAQAAARDVAVSVAAELANAGRASSAVVDFDSVNVAESINLTRMFRPLDIISQLPGHANGTTNAEPVFIAGEEGPELIVGRQGSTVFPTKETDRLIEVVQNRQPNLPSWNEVNKDSRRDGNYLAYQGQQDNKRIVLEIAGSGAIEVGRGADKESIMEVLYEQLRPTLMQILQTEIFEEGDLAYDY